MYITVLAGSLEREQESRERERERMQAARVRHLRRVREEGGARLFTRVIQLSWVDCRVEKGRGGRGGLSSRAMKNLLQLRARGLSPARPKLAPRPCIFPRSLLFFLQCAQFQFHGGGDVVVQHFRISLDDRLV